MIDLLTSIENNKIQEATTFIITKLRHNGKNYFVEARYQDILKFLELFVNDNHKDRNRFLNYASIFIEKCNKGFTNPTYKDSILNAFFAILPREFSNLNILSKEELVRKASILASENFKHDLFTEFQIELNFSNDEPNTINENINDLKEKIGKLVVASNTDVSFGRMLTESDLELINTCLAGIINESEVSRRLFLTKYYSRFLFCLANDENRQTIANSPLKNEIFENSMRLFSSLSWGILNNKKATFYCLVLNSFHFLGVDLANMDIQIANPQNIPAVSFNSKDINKLKEEYLVWKNHYDNDKEQIKQPVPTNLTLQVDNLPIFFKASIGFCRFTKWQNTVDRKIIVVNNEYEFETRVGNFWLFFN